MRLLCSLLGVIEFALDLVLFSSDLLVLFHNHVALEVELHQVFDQSGGIGDGSQRGVLAESGLERLNCGDPCMSDAVGTEELGVAGFQLFKFAQFLADILRQFLRLLSSVLGFLRGSGIGLSELLLVV